MAGVSTHAWRTKLIRQWLGRLLVVGLLSGLGTAASQTLTLEVDRLATSMASVDDLNLTLEWPAGVAQGRLHLTAAVLDASEFGYRWRDLSWTCELQHEADTWQCAGPIKARGASGLSLSARLDAGALVLEASNKTTRLHLSQPASDAAPLQLELVRVPATWLAPLLAKAWEQGHPTGGTLDLNWQLQLGDDGLGFSGPVAVTGLGLDSADGSIAAEGIRVAGQVRGEVKDVGTTLDLALELRGGEVLLGALYAALPETPVELGLRVREAGPGTWQLQALRWRDPGVMELSGSARLQATGESMLQQLQLSYSIPSLALAQERYFESLMASLGLSGFTLTGAVKGQLELADADWQAIDLHLDAVQVGDEQNRFVSEDLSGDLRLRHGKAAAASQLAWQSVSLYGLALGPASLSLDSAEGGLALKAPVAIPLFGGTVRMRTFDYLPGDEDDHLDLALALERVDLAALSTAFGWPAFAGTVSGDLPGVRLRGNHLEFEGGLSAQLFDGQVQVSQLSMERPFGVAPMLAASIEFKGLDLEPLTAAFDFGEITGRLDGHIRDLRLLDWEPAAFDASFHTVKTSGVRQRISQRAVRDLTEVGGGGIAAGLQAQMLKTFSSFGYSRIGLSCVLANNVCTMAGVEAANNGGYIIVDGSGLPRVNVIGHQRKVDWPVLLGRLKAATEGQMPVID